MRIALNLIGQIADYLNFSIIKALGIGKLVLEFKIIKRIFR
jgi:hypothetical protein